MPARRHLPVPHPVAGRTRPVAHGAVAGVAGTVALHATTYLDMAVRGRPASSTPEETVERLTQVLRLPLPEEPPRRKTLMTRVGSVLGLGAGVVAGIGTGLLRSRLRSDSPLTTVAVAGGIALVVGNAPMTLLGVTDPRTWSARDWVEDLVPHAMYALAAAGTWHVLRVRHERPSWPHHPPELNLRK